MSIADDARTLLVRPLLPGDLPFAYDLSARVFARYARDPDANLRGIVGRAGAVVLIAEHARRPVGFLAFHVTPLGRPFGPWENPGRGYLDAIAVEPEVHGRGAGKALLRHAVRAAREQGAVSMTLMTADTNQRAVRLFLSFGFHPVFAEVDAYRNGQRGIVFTRGLDAGDAPDDGARTT